MHRALLVSALVVAGCVSGDPDKGRLGFYDRIDFLRAKYNATLDARDFVGSKRVELEIEREAKRRFATIASDATAEQDSRRRYLATFALGYTHLAEAGPPLVAALDDRDPIIRVQAALSLGELAVPNPPMEKVKTLLDDPALYVRTGALVALRRLLAPGQDAGLAPRIVGLLEDPAEEIRNETAQLMGVVRKAEFMEPLAVRGLRDASLLVRLNASMALGRFGAVAEAYVPQLIETLKDLEHPVVLATHWALKEVTGRDFDRSYHTWRDWYEEEQTKYEYFCRNHAEVVRPVAGVCPTCQQKLERRLKPNLPKRDEKKDDKK